MAHEVDVAQAELLGERSRQLGLEQPAACKQRLTEAHAGDAGRLEPGVEPVVRDPALPQQDRPEPGADLFLEVAVIQPRRGRARGEPQTAAEVTLVSSAAHRAKYRRARAPGRSPEGWTS